MRKSILKKTEPVGYAGLIDEPCRLDREADHLLASGRTAQAELLSHRAEAMRAGVRT